MSRYVLSLFTLLFAWNTVNAQAPVQFFVEQLPGEATIQIATSNGETHQETIQLSQLSKGIYLCQVYLANGEPIGFERIVISK